MSARDRWAIGSAGLLRLIPDWPIRIRQPREVLTALLLGQTSPGAQFRPGVTKAGTNTAINNDGQNGGEPRVGFAWQLPKTNRLVLRGGYGIFYTRTTGEPFIQLLGAPLGVRFARSLRPTPPRRLRRRRPSPSSLHTLPRSNPNCRSEAI